MSDRTGGQATAGTPGAGPDEASALADLDALAPAADRARLAGLAAARPLIAARAAQLQRETSPGDTTYSPSTNYAVLRATQDFRGGNSGIGTMITAVNRRMDQWSSPYLASSAYVGSIDFRHRFFKNNYEISGNFDQGLVRGSTAMIASLQNNGVHLFQRPDANFPL